MVLEKGLTVVALKWGNKYKPVHYNVLEDMVRRHLDQRHEFVVMTDNPVGIRARTIPMPCDLPRCWGKLLFFMKEIPGIRTQDILYLDVDVVITGDLYKLAFNPAEFVIIRDWMSDEYGHCFFNSSVFKLTVGSRAYIWDQYLVEGKPLEDLKRGSYRNPIPGVYRGDQCFIWQHCRQNDFEVFPRTWCLSFKINKLKDGPRGAKIVVFHGNPNPWDVIGEAPWIGQYWR